MRGASATFEKDEVKVTKAELLPPKNFDHMYSETTKHRKPNIMKQYYKIFGIPGIGQLAGGLPNVRFFPFDTLEAQTAKPERWTPTPNQSSSSAASLTSQMDLMSVSTTTSSEPSAAAKHITVPQVLPADTNRLKRVDLATALQYGQAQGYPPLLEWIREFTTKHLHPDIPYKGGVDVTFTVGSTDGFAKTLELFVDPWSPEHDHPEDRPGMLCETFVYPTVLAQSMPKGVQIVPIVADEDGMCPNGEGGLEQVMADWDPKMGRRPHLLYTVSMGHNPTGIVMSLERRKAIYSVCSKYDIIIVEDDPYWYLQFPSAETEEAKSRKQLGWSRGSDALPSPHNPIQTLPKTKGTSSGYDFLDSLTPSFLSVDTDGRVVRLDTFSKVVAPGCRLGWITAQPALIERFIRISETSTQQPSGFVQSLIAELVMGSPSVSNDTNAGKNNSTSSSSSSSLFSWRSSKPDPAAVPGWKMDGWIRWLEGLRGMYERRMVRMCRILDEGAFNVETGVENPESTTNTTEEDMDSSLLVTKTRLYDFDWPRGGMFVWLRVYLENHPLYNAFSSDGSHVIEGTSLATGMVLFLTQKPHLVAISPGLMFCANDDIAVEKGFKYFRMCFAAEDEDKLDECSLRFTQGVHAFFRLNKVEELEKILEGTPGAESVDRDEVDNLGMYMGC